MAFIIALLLLVLIHEFGHYFAAKKNGVYVEEFGFGFPPRIIGKKIGETIYSLNWLPIGGFVKLFGEEYHNDLDEKSKTKIPKNRAFVNKKPWQKAVIIVAGVVMNFLLAWVIFSYLFIGGIPQPAGAGISEVQVNSPAENVGIISGDRLVSISQNGENIDINLSQDLINATNKFAGKPVSLTVERDGKLQVFTLTPRENPPKDEGSLGVVITQLTKEEKYPWYTAPFHAFSYSFTMIKTIIIELVKLPASLFVKTVQPVEFSGPVGIAKIVNEATKYGIDAWLQIVAILSLNLAAINILPFPALDGGRLIFIIYEWITGKKSNENFEKYLNLAGIIILISASALITFIDIKNYYSGEGVFKDFPPIENNVQDK